MADLPCPPQMIHGGIEEPTTQLPGRCQNPNCDRWANDTHHIVRRSYLGDAYPTVRIELPWGMTRMPNVVALCRDCHDLLERNKQAIALDDMRGDWLWVANGDSRKIDYLHDKEHEELRPGEKCPTCGHRKAYPRKKSSPITKPYPVHMPREDWDTFKEILEGAEQWIGVEHLPHASYKVVVMALAHLMQDEEMKDWYKKEAFPRS
jgi:hypothetical protein